MDNHDELIKGLFWHLENIYRAVGKAEEKNEYIRTAIDVLAKKIKNELETSEYDYTKALDSILKYSEGETYKSLVMIFGVTPDERERMQAVEEYQDKEKQRWEAYVKKCEEEGISPYITNKPYVPSGPPDPNDWSIGFGG